MHKKTFFSLSDVDECKGMHLCTDQCKNTPGSYSCSCSEGFGLDDDGHTCHGKYVLVIVWVERQYIIITHALHFAKCKPGTVTKLVCGSPAVSKASYVASNDLTVLIIVSAPMYL